MTRQDWFACAASAALMMALGAAAPAFAAGSAPGARTAAVLSATALTSAFVEDDEDEDEDCELEDSSQCPGEDQTVEVEEWDKFLEGKERIEGFFTFYRDEETGELFMEVADDQLDEEFIYFSYVHDGSRRDGMRVAGLVGENSVLSLRRRYRHMDVILRNTGFSMDEDTPLARSAGTNVANPILVTLEVASENEETGAVVVKANDLFMTNSLVRIGQQSALGRLFGIAPGTLNARKTNIRSVRAYEDNTEVVAEFAFDWASANTPFASSDTTTVQHSFLRMPDEGFEPRLADPRVGFFTERRTNLTRLEGNPADDLIQRWRLEKTDPDAAVSDVVEPITFWIENTTPSEYRDAVRQGALAWNPLFEAAGFRNAIRVEVQPDDAEWDAGDVNYNVIRWMSSPMPLFAGYGPRYTNPRTGEIVGADIVIEHATVQRWLRTDRLFPEAGGTVASSSFADEGAHDHAAMEDAPDFAEHLHRPGHMCEAGAHMAMNAGFARIAATTLAGGSADSAIAERIVSEGLVYVVAHEVGHTLGLTHNMMGSFYSPLEALNGDAGRHHQKLTASIMDYPGVNVSPERDEQGYYFPETPGTYDYWAIRFGYAPDLSDARARTAHLNRSTEPQHVFANDADDMRSPGLGMDPRVNVYSLSNDPIAFAARQVELSRSAIETLADVTARPGESWEETRNSFDLLMSMYVQSASVMSRFVGGVYSDQSFVGQANAAEAPLVPVSADEQRRAIRELGRLIFSEEAFEFPPELVARLQPERRGFDYFGRVTEPELQRIAGRIQGPPLAHLLHPRVLNRLTDTMSYGGDYSTRDMLRDLTGEIFNGAASTVSRRNLQIDYVDRLVRARNAGSLQRVPASAVHDTLRRIEGMHSGPDFWMDDETKAHRRYLRERISQALEA